MPKAWVVGAIAFVCGAVTASGAWTAFPPAKKPVATPTVTPEPKEDNDLETANKNLTASLHECDRRLAELGEHPVGVPAVASAAPSDSGGRRDRRRDRGSM